MDRDDPLRRGPSLSDHRPEPGRRISFWEAAPFAQILPEAHRRPRSEAHSTSPVYEMHALKWRVPKSFWRGYFGMMQEKLQDFAVICYTMGVFFQEAPGILQGKADVDPFELGAVWKG